jgi:hypothetical protein
MLTNLLRRFTVPATPDSPAAALHVQESQHHDQVHLYSSLEGETGGVYLTAEAFQALASLAHFSSYGNHVRFIETPNPFKEKPATYETDDVKI